MLVVPDPADGRDAGACCLSLVCASYEIIPFPYLVVSVLNLEPPQPQSFTEIRWK